MLELVDEYKEPFARQRTMNRTIFNLQEHNMLCTVVGWTAQHADEAWLPHTKIPQEYRLACRGKRAVVTLNMEQIHEAEHRSKELARNIIMRNVMSLSKPPQVCTLTLIGLPPEIIKMIVECVIELRINELGTSRPFQRNLYYVDRFDGQLQVESIYIDLRDPATQGDPFLNHIFNADFVGSQDAYWEKHVPYLLEDGASSLPFFSLHQARDSMTKLLPLVVCHMFERPGLNHLFGQAETELANATDVSTWTATFLRLPFVLRAPKLLKLLDTTIQALVNLRCDIQNAQDRSRMRDKAPADWQLRPLPGLASWAEGEDLDCPRSALF
jgi:hypothetical protein